MKIYNKPDVELIYFSEDVITTSTGVGPLNHDDDGVDIDWDF